MKKLISLLTAGVIILGMSVFSGCARFEAKNDNPPLNVPVADNRHA